MMECCHTSISHRSPPSLQLICNAILVVTLMSLWLFVMLLYSIDAEITILNPIITFKYCHHHHYSHSIIEPYLTKRHCDGTGISTHNSFLIASYLSFLADGNTHTTNCDDCLNVFLMLLTYELVLSSDNSMSCGSFTVIPIAPATCVFWSVWCLVWSIGCGKWCMVSVV